MTKCLLSQKIKLFECEAIDFSNFKKRHCDTVILNSIVQYFPNIFYLKEVLNKSVDLIEKSGSIFVGDVRNYQHLIAFHVEKIVKNLGGKEDTNEIVNKISHSIYSDNELSISPNFFYAFSKENKRITQVEILLKTEKFTNEISQFRYDVIFHVGKNLDENHSVCTVKLRDREASLNKINEILTDNKSKFIKITDIPNNRVNGAYEVINAISQSKDSDVSVGNLKKKFNPKGLNPYDVISIAKENKLFCKPVLSDKPENFDCYFYNIEFLIPSKEISNCSSFSNIPSKTELKKLLFLIKGSEKHFLIDEALETAMLLFNTNQLTLYNKNVKKITEKFTYYEKTLYEIWKDFFKPQYFSKNDNFFSLGGHSLMAIKLLDLIEEKFSVKLEIEDIFNNPTINSLSSTLSEKSNSPKNYVYSEGKSLIKLKNGNNEAPIFFIHPVGGTVFCYLPLVSYLDTNRPIYAIQDPGLAANRVIFSSIEEMASNYINLIKKVQPEGAYTLIGASLGGTIAYEMGKQLESTQETIEHIVMLDTWAILSKKEKERKHFEEKMRNQHDLLQKKLNISGIKNTKKWLAINYHRLELAVKYIPKSINSEVTLFKAIELSEDSLQYNDQYNFWKLHTQTNLSVILTNGNHETMLFEPHVTQLAIQLTTVLESSKLLLA